MIDPTTIITIGDFRRVYCVSGVFERMELTDFDFRAFVRDGLPVHELMGKGFDALIERVIEAKVTAEAMNVTVAQTDEDDHGR